MKTTRTSKRGKIERTRGKRMAKGGESETRWRNKRGRGGRRQGRVRKGNSIGGRDGRERRAKGKKKRKEWNDKE